MAARGIVFADVSPVAIYTPSKKEIRINQRTGRGVCGAGRRQAQPHALMLLPTQPRTRKSALLRNFLSNPIHSSPAVFSQRMAQSTGQRRANFQIRSMIRSSGAPGRLMQRPCSMSSSLVGSCCLASHSSARSLWRSSSCKLMLLVGIATAEIPEIRRINN